MKNTEIDKFGIYIVLINITLILFMITNEQASIINYVVAAISALVAIVFNIIILKHGKKKILNIISLIINILIFLSTIIYTLIKYKII